MRYLLAVGFHCDVYRKEPRARVFVNDILIDEFLIKHKNKNIYNLSSEIKIKYTEDLLNPKSNNGFIPIFYPNLKIYEIEINQSLKKLKINIDIDNSDSNYNNGFISKSTLIRLNLLTLYPYEKSIFHKLYQRNLKKLISEEYAWYHKKLMYFLKFFNLIDCAVWNDKNNKEVINNPNNTIGGSGSFLCEVEKDKKHNLFFKRTGVIFLNYLKNKILLDILNKYKQHANQRNSD